MKADFSKIKDEVGDDDYLNHSINQKAFIQACFDLFGDDRQKATRKVINNGYSVEERQQIRKRFYFLIERPWSL